MATFRVTRHDGSVELIEADLVIADRESYDFVRFVAGGQERYVTRAASEVSGIEETRQP